MKSSRTWSFQTTLVAWPDLAATDPIVVWRVGRLPVLSDAGVADRLGLPDVDPVTLRDHEGDLLVDAAPDARARWMTADRRRAFEEWPHGGEFARGDGHAGWRTPGTVTAQRLAELLERIPAARRLMG